MFHKRKSKRHQKVRLNPIGKVIVGILVAILVASLAWGTYAITKQVHKINVQNVKKAADKAKKQRPKGVTQDIVNAIDSNIGEEATLDLGAVLDESKIVVEQTTSLTTVGDSTDAAIPQ